MWNLSRTFFSNKKAEEFADFLKANKAEDIVICSGRDGFGQNVYSVRWN